jgi:hypothetical protein
MEIARTISDQAVRVKLLALAQKWLALANERVIHRIRNVRKRYGAKFH